MSGKNKKNKTPGERKFGNLATVTVLIIVLVLGVAAILLLSGGEDNPDNPEKDGDITVSEITGPEDTIIKTENLEGAAVELGEGLLITDIGSYTGIYMEDGSDEVVTGVMMIVVTNNGEKPLQYAEISFACGEETAKFSLSTLPVGKSAVVLEQSRMNYESGAKYSSAEAKNVIWFDGELSLCEDKLEIQSLDGAMNITNISGEDITGEIVIYYKNSAVDMLYGGITYRIRITDGLAAGEIKQIISDHYSAKGSTIMFVTCG